MSWLSSIQASYILNIISYYLTHSDIKQNYTLTSSIKIDTPNVFAISLKGC